MLKEKSLVNFQDIETPFYYYDLELLKKTLKVVVDNSSKYDFHVHYALKANFNERILKIIKDAGLGADCVSGNEVLKALEVGFKSDKIVFAGVGKSDKEIITGLESDIFAFNVESLQEIEVISSLAKSINKTAKIALRINPNVDAQTHHYITTGLDENKFGIQEWELEQCIDLFKKNTNIKLIGIHFHIGSQITDLKVFESLSAKVNMYNKWFLDRGFDLKVLNVGGGLGVNYKKPDEEPIPDFESYFKIFNEHLDRREGQEIHFELGRSIVAQSGNLISRVLYVKKGIKKNFVILDAGMTELMRPALYQAYHKVENLRKDTENTKEFNYDVVGPICESSDTFIKDIKLPEVFRNDIFAIRSGGAYGEVMASRYNLRDEIRYVYSDEI